MKIVGMSILFIGLMLLWQFGLTSLLNIFPKHKKEAHYHYEYITDSLRVGSHFTIVSIDTIPPTSESGGIIQVHLK